MFSLSEVGIPQTYQSFEMCRTLLLGIAFLQVFMGLFLGILFEVFMGLFIVIGFVFVLGMALLVGAMILVSDSLVGATSTVLQLAIVMICKMKRVFA